MATIYRRLLKPNRKSEQLLIFVIKYGVNVRLDYSSGIKLHSGHWGKQKLAKRSYSKYEQLNDHITSLEATILLIINQVVLSGEKITTLQIKTKLDFEFQRAKRTEIKKNNKPVTFFDFCDTYIRHSNTTKKRTTMLTYKHTIRALKIFDPKLDFKDITHDFYSAFIAHLRDEYGLLDNSIGKDIKNLKAILNEATEQGYNHTFDYRSKRFKTFRHEADTIYLTRKELITVADLDLSSRPGLDRVRDLFIIGCYTGLRFSDLKNLSSDNIIIRDEGTYIQIRTQKTGKLVMVPLNSVVSAIVHKYNGNIPDAISNQKMNAALKEICKLAELDTLVQITKTRAGVMEKHVMPKCQLVTTHTARRSFATNAYLSGVPGLAIMKITGHKSESSFMKYIKGSQEENATTLSKHPFFH